LKLAHDATVEVAEGPQTLALGLDERCRLAARDRPRVALRAGRQAYLDDHADCVHATGKRPVVGNGPARACTLATGAGAIEVAAPRADDPREGHRYGPVVLPAYSHHHLRYRARMGPDDLGTVVEGPTARRDYRVRFPDHMSGFPDTCATIGI